jgi:hypothetical protein
MRLLSYTPNKVYFFDKKSGRSRVHPVVKVAGSLGLWYAIGGKKKGPV